MAEADATLLGRNRYEALASCWPQADPADEMTATMNGARKYVVSNTLSEAAWQNSSVINGDVNASVAALKQTTGLSRPAARRWSAGYSKASHRWRRHSLHSSQAVQSNPARGLTGLVQPVSTPAATGEARGTVRYEWMPGRFFLLQHAELTQYGQQTIGLEVIGHLRPFGEPPSEEVCSRFYDWAGNTLDYVYELTGNTLTIWAGAKGGPAYYRGEFSADDQTLSGDWVYPDGGGYRLNHDPLLNGPRR
jgi:hypothetical protein